MYTVYAFHVVSATFHDKVVESQKFLVIIELVS